MKKRKKPQRWTKERRQRAVELYLSGMTTTEVAKEIGSSRHRVCDALRKEGVKARDPYRFGSGDENPMWSGGRTESKGYVYLYRPDHPSATIHNQVAEHRLVMEEHIGRYLLPCEVVHHKNGDTRDNRIENLELFATNGEHLAHELAGKCPRWSEDGKMRIRQAVRERHKRRSSTHQ